jgi:hypothetical protein
MGGSLPNYIIPSPDPVGTNKLAQMVWGQSAAAFLQSPKVIPKWQRVFQAGAQFHNHVVRKIGAAGTLLPIECTTIAIINSQEDLNC